MSAIALASCVRHPCVPLSSAAETGKGSAPNGNGRQPMADVKLRYFSDAIGVQYDAQLSAPVFRSATSPLYLWEAFSTLQESYRMSLVPFPTLLGRTI